MPEQSTEYAYHQVGVDYCPTHGGIRNEDDACCDFADDGGENCNLTPLFYRTQIDSSAPQA